MSLNTFQKNFIFAITTVTLLFSGVFGGYLGVKSFRARREWVRISDAKARVERVMALSTCSKFSDSERLRVDKANSNPYETKAVLLEIHKERADLWIGETTSAKNRMDYYRAAHAASEYTSYVPQFNQAVADKDEAIHQVKGFLSTIHVLEQHDPSAPFEKLKNSKALTTDKQTSRRAGAI